MIVQFIYYRRGKIFTIFKILKSILIIYKNYKWTFSLLVQSIGILREEEEKQNRKKSICKHLFSIILLSLYKYSRLIKNEESERE